MTAGAGLLGWIAGGMMMNDPALIKQFGEGLADYATIAGIAGAIGVMAVGELVKRSSKKAKT